MNKQRVSPFFTKWWFWVGAIVAVFILSLFIEPPQYKPTTQPKDVKNTFLVTRVIDGDTIVIEGGQKVRYIGINTPETVHPFKFVECFGIEASRKNKELVEGKEVRLEKDVSQTDQYGRLLRYVYVEDTFVNDFLVREGYAYASTYSPDVKYAAQFILAQQEAKDNNRGLWKSCQAQSKAKSQFEVTHMSQPQPAPPPPKPSYICSYNAYNCSDFATYAEAQTVYEGCGGLTNDIHRLDRDKDGIACERLP